MTDITISESVTELGKYAFEGCTGLKNVIIKCELKEMSYIFEGCTSLETVTLPKTIKKMNDVFRKCDALKAIYVPAKRGDFYKKKVEKPDLVVELPAEKKTKK